MNNMLPNLLQFLVLIPCAILCYAPMKDKLSMKHSKFLLEAFLVLVLSISVGTIVCTYFNVGPNFILFPMLVVIYLFYHKTLNVGMAQSLAVFAIVMAFMSLPSCYSIVCDAYLHPTGTIDDGCIVAPIAQLIFSFTFLLIFAPLFYKFGGNLIRKLSIQRIWYAVTPLFVAFIAINVLTLPKRYETLYVNRVFITYVVLLMLELFILLFICFLFYLVSTQILKSAEESKQLQQLLMQKHQFKIQQKYMEESARMRHDFRQSVYTMHELVNNGEYESLKKYIEKFTNTLPKNEVKIYCENSAVNALLNYYAYQMKKENIATNWDISLPLEISVPETEICALLGNILENAVDGCLTIPTDKRCHKLSVTVEHDTSLYIVSLNSFDGKIKKKNGQYVSTHSGGHGIGLSSIMSTAEKYGGQVKFSNTDSEFSTDVVLNIT